MLECNVVFSYLLNCDFYFPLEMLTQDLFILDWLMNLVRYSITARWHVHHGVKHNASFDPSVAFIRCRSWSAPQHGRCLMERHFRLKSDNLVLKKK